MSQFSGCGDTRQIPFFSSLLSFSLSAPSDTFCVGSCGGGSTNIDLKVEVLPRRKRKCCVSHEPGAKMDVPDLDIINIKIGSKVTCMSVKIGPRCDSVNNLPRLPEPMDHIKLDLPASSPRPLLSFPSHRLLTRSFSFFVPKSSSLVVQN